LTDIEGKLQYPTFPLRAARKVRQEPSEEESKSKAILVGCKTKKCPRRDMFTSPAWRKLFGPKTFGFMTGRGKSESSLELSWSKAYEAAIEITKASKNRQQTGEAVYLLRTILREKRGGTRTSGVAAMVSNSKRRRHRAAVRDGSHGTGSLRKDEGEATSKSRNVGRRVEGKPGE